jgi:hypothetical protein
LTINPTTSSTSSASTSTNAPTTPIDAKEGKNQTTAQQQVVEPVEQVAERWTKNMLFLVRLMLHQEKKKEKSISNNNILLSLQRENSGGLSLLSFLVDLFSLLCCVFFSGEYSAKKPTSQLPTLVRSMSDHYKSPSRNSSTAATTSATAHLPVLNNRLTIPSDVSFLLSFIKTGSEENRASLTQMYEAARKPPLFMFARLTLLQWLTGLFAFPFLFLLTLGSSLVYFLQTL